MYYRSPTTKWCPHCRRLRETRVEPFTRDNYTEHAKLFRLGEYDTSRIAWVRVPLYDNVAYFRRLVRCLHCNKLWITAEVYVEEINAVVLSRSVEIKENKKLRARIEALERRVAELEHATAYYHDEPTPRMVSVDQPPDGLPVG